MNDPSLYLDAGSLAKPLDCFTLLAPRRQAQIHLLVELVICMMVYHTPYIARPPQMRKASHGRYWLGLRDLIGVVRG